MIRKPIFAFAAFGAFLCISCSEKADDASADSGAADEGLEDDEEDDGGDEGFDVTILTGRTYEVDLGSADFVQPAGVGTIIASILSQSILLGVEDVNDTSIQMMGALSKESASLQDFCNPTLAFPTADFTSSPYFQIGPADTTLGVAGASVTIVDFQIGGEFAADASSFNNGVLTGQIDLREMMQIEAVAALGDDPATLCELVDTLSSGEAICQDCGDGQAYCLDVEVVDIMAYESNQVLEHVDSCDPSRCEEGCR